MQKHNLKNIAKKLEQQEKKQKKQETYLNVLAFSNLALWGLLIINQYFL